MDPKEARAALEAARTTEETAAGGKEGLQKLFNVGAGVFLGISSAAIVMGAQWSWIAIVLSLVVAIGALIMSSRQPVRASYKQPVAGAAEESDPAMNWVAILIPLGAIIGIQLLPDNNWTIATLAGIAVAVATTGALEFQARQR